MQGRVIATSPRKHVSACRQFFRPREWPSKRGIEAQLSQPLRPSAVHIDNPAIFPTDPTVIRAS